MTVRKSRATDLTGATYGALSVIGRLNPGEPGASLWLCRCECGRQETRSRKSLANPKVKSCLVCARQIAVNAHVEHGLSKTPEYAAWNRMRNRCLNPNNDSYADYGARGIGFCERWQKFENFLADMGPKPEGMSLDRLDNDKGYSPENCRWADDFEQARNRRNVRLYDVNGKSVCVSEMAIGAAVCRNSVRKRILRGWSPEEAMMTPANLGKRGAR